MGNLGDRRHNAPATVEVVVLQAQALIATKRKFIADLKSDIEDLRDRAIKQKEAEIKHFELDILDIEKRMANIPTSNIKQLASEVIDSEIIDITEGG